jgi:DNA-binding response OmpR family regulator
MFLVKILIVEDEHRIANSIKKGLEQEKYVVDVAYDGIEGLDMASSQDYDLIILDLMLPSMDGLTVCRHLRDHNIHTPVLILTAKSQLEDKVSGLNCGADDYLTKPFAFEELLARIRALLRRPANPIVSILTVEDLVIRLSAKEFSLLEFMMRHADKIVTKQKLIDHVWDYDSNILPNTIEVYIKNLRRKIDQPFPTQPSLIQTIRGFGYRLGREI